MSTKPNGYLKWIRILLRSYLYERTFTSEILPDLPTPARPRTASLTSGVAFVFPFDVIADTGMKNGQFFSLLILEISCQLKGWKLIRGTDKHILGSLWRVWVTCRQFAACCIFVIPSYCPIRKPLGPRKSLTPQKGHPLWFGEISPHNSPEYKRRQNIYIFFWSEESRNATTKAV